MKSKVNIILLLSLFSFCFYACSNIGSNPSDVLSKYLDARYNFEHKKAYSYLSKEDTSVKSIDEYLSEKKDNEAPISKVFADKIDYKITKVEKNKDKAKAIVELTVPDGQQIFGDLMGSFLSKLFNEDFDEEKIASKIKEKYKDEGIPMTTKKDTMNLVKEENKWRVYLNWKAEKQKKKIKNLLSEAEELEEENPNKAIKKYKKILEFDSQLVNQIKGVKKIENKISTIEEQQKYLENKIQLYDLNAEYYDTFLEDNIPGVTFKLKNNGERTLTEISVTVYFKDSEGNVIFEEDYNPVLISDYSDDKPLKPNYIWSLNKDKFYKAESVPSEWEEGEVSAKITDIEFDNNSKN